MERLILNKREYGKQKAAAHAVIVTVCVLAAVAAAIQGMHGCKNSAYPAPVTPAAQQASAEPTAAPALDIVSEEYYRNSAFVGNSFADEVMLSKFLKDTDCFSRIGLNAADAMTKTTDTGKVPVIDELNVEKKYDKIFMMFGENELGWLYADKFAEAYGALIDKARIYQPNAKIYLLAITPVTKKVSDKNIDCTNNTRIAEYNALISQLAKDKGVIFADIFSAVSDETGALPEGAASDGIHFGSEYYKRILLHIQNNYE